MTDRRTRLADGRLYLCTPTPLCPAGVDLVQLRRKGLEWRDEVEQLSHLGTLARRVGALLSANDRADVAAFADVDVLHVGQDDLPPRLARQLLGPDVLIGLSAHDERQLEQAAADPDVDYFCVGPVWATPTSRAVPGGRVAASAGPSRPPFAAGSKPWFVTGGVAPETLDRVLDTGARRVVVVRALTEAADPAEVAATLAERLRRREPGARHFVYLGVLAFCLISTAPLEVVLRARVYRRPLRLALTLLPVVVFVGDLYAIARGHWTYDLGPRRRAVLLPGRLPLDELLFFLVIPICAVLTLEAVRAVKGWTAGRADFRGPCPGSALDEPQRASSDRPRDELHRAGPARGWCSRSSSTWSSCAPRLLTRRTSGSPTRSSSSSN